MVSEFAGLMVAMVLVAAVIYTPLFLLNRRAANRRSAERAACARSLGLEHIRYKKPVGILDKRFYLARRASPDQDVIWGRWRGLPVSYADYHTVSMGDPTYMRIDYSVACAALNIEVPHLRVWRKRSGRELRVKSRDDEFAGKLIDADMMAWLLSSDARLRFEVGGNQLAVYTSGSVDPPWLFDAAFEFATHILEAVLDDYQLPAIPS